MRYTSVCVCFYDRPFTFYTGVYSGFSRKERWKRAGWSSWHWGEYYVIWDWKKKSKRTANQAVEWCHCHLILPGASWFTWTQGDEGLPRDGWSPRTNWVTRVTRKTRTKGNKDRKLDYFYYNKVFLDETPSRYNKCLVSGRWWSLSATTKHWPSILRYYRNI